MEHHFAPFIPLDDSLASGTEWSVRQCAQRSLQPSAVSHRGQSLIVAWLLCGVHTEFGALPLGLLSSEHC